MERDKERIRVVVDSNIIFSLIIKCKNITYIDIFLKGTFEAYAPEDIIREFRNHRKTLENKSEEFERVGHIPRKIYNINFHTSNTIHDPESMKVIEYECSDQILQ